MSSPALTIRSVTNEVAEKDALGTLTSTSIRIDHKIRHATQAPVERLNIDGTPATTQSTYQGAFLNFLTRVFLPKGYPDSVPPDYTRFVSFPVLFPTEDDWNRYQIYNALQAFCNSLAGLIASRALLEGQGIGDASASATDALLLNVILDVFSRMTTIVSAHLLGTSLVPDAKRYRLLADILNDSALALDTVSPLFNTYGLPGLRIAALCLSASFRALCGIVAGGSKAAISMHFATPLSGKGDIGDLNAKDSSKETVLALFGMLLGSLIVPRLTTPFATYTALFFLIGMHIALNYLGVQSLVLRTMNHERLWISWFLYHENEDEPDFTPELVNSLERIFPVSKTELFKLPIPVPGVPRSISLVNPFKMETLSTFRDPLTQEALGYVTLGSRLSSVLQKPLHPDLVSEFQHWTDFIMWFDKRCLVYPKGGSEDRPVNPILSSDVLPHIHICFKDRSTPGTRVFAWLAAGLICKSIARHRASAPDSSMDANSVFVGALSSSMDKGEMEVDEMVWRLCKPRSLGFRFGSGDDGQSLWRKWKGHAEKLGWDVVADEGETKGKGRSTEDEGEQEKEEKEVKEEVDWGSELGVTVPEPKIFVAGLGYSYQAKKTE